jgi:hypothetical protein
VESQFVLTEVGAHILKFHVNMLNEFRQGWAGSFVAPLATKFTYKMR